MFYFDKVLDKEVLKSDFLNGTNAFFTTKELILKSKEPENVEIIKSNIEALKAEFDLDKITSPKQTHTDNIKLAGDIDLSETDALILTDKKTGIFLNFADCTPIIFYDKKQNIGAIAHAGWRGTASKISYKTALKLINEFNSSIENIYAVIGPSICYKCFETNEEIAIKLSETIGNTEFIRRRGQKFYADLKRINAEQIKSLGIKNIDIADYCTCCNNDKFYSYRLENKTTNRISAFLSLI